MKKILSVLLVLVLALSFAACAKTEKAPEATTPATKLLAEFKTLVADEKDTEVLAGKLAESEALGELGVATMPVEEGYLNGFSAEIKGFTKGTMFAPMIGSIPVVGYVFETEDADALVTALKENADLRWNICTQADEMVCENVDGLVFFMMAPASFDEPTDDAEPELPEIPDELTPDAGAEIPDDADLGISIG